MQTCNGVGMESYDGGVSIQHEWKKEFLGFMRLCVTFLKLAAASRCIVASLHHAESCKLDKRLDDSS